MCNESTRQKGKKKNSTLQNQSFEHNGMKIYDLQRLESLEEKKVARMQTGFGDFIAKGDRLANSRDVNPLETIWIIVDEDKEPKNTKNQPPNNWTS